MLNRYTTEIDVWSLGCVIAEMHLSHPLFMGKEGYYHLRDIFSSLKATIPKGMVEKSQIAKFFKKVGDDYVIIPEKEYLCISDVKTPSQREPTKELSVLISEKDFVIQKKGREKDSIYLLILSF